MSEEAPRGDVVDNNYQSRTGDKDQVPVQRDEDFVEDGVDSVKADSDAQLEKDDAEAIDKSNIIDERTRGAGKPKGALQEPGDEENIPTDE